MEDLFLRMKAAVGIILGHSVVYKVQVEGTVKPLSLHFTCLNCIFPKTNKN